MNQGEQSTVLEVALPAPRKPANDLKSLDERYLETLDACRFWKYMPRERIREQSFVERIQRAEMLKIVANLEKMLGRPI